MAGQILVVDRATTSRITLKVRLSAACYDTLTARSGAEAMACLTRISPDLVVIGGEPMDMTAVALCRMIAAAAGESRSQSRSRASRAIRSRPSVG